MTQLTRRQMLVGTAATAVAAALPFAASSPVGAAAPAVGRQAPGFYRYKVGSIEVTVVADGINRMPVTDSFVLNAKKDEVNAALAAAFMEKDVFVGPYNPIVVNTGAKLAVIDTGTGEAAYRDSQGDQWSVSDQSGGGGHRRQYDRCRDHLALPRRPH